MRKLRGLGNGYVHYCECGEGFVGVYMSSLVFVSLKYEQCTLCPLYLD